MFEALGSGKETVDNYLLGDLVEGLGLLGEHILCLVPVPGPGALCVHLHCHLMRGRDTVTRGDQGGHQTIVMALAAVKS